jgi:hypothetical protein
MDRIREGGIVAEFDLDAMNTAARNRHTIIHFKVHKEGKHEKTKNTFDGNCSRSHLSDGIGTGNGRKIDPGWKPHTVDRPLRE